MRRPFHKTGASHAHRQLKGRVLAGEKCATEGWTAGTVLTSEAWKYPDGTPCPHRLQHVDPLSVLLQRELSPGGHWAGGNPAMTLPSDVRRA